MERSARTHAVPIRVTIVFNRETTASKVAELTTDHETAAIDFREETTDHSRAATGDFNRETIDFNRAGDLRRRTKASNPGNAKIKFASYRTCK